MLIIADTTPIISLVKIGLLNLLDGMYGEILLPAAVYDELVCNPAMEKEAEMIKNSPFISVRTVENQLAVTILRKQLNLGAGESEAIILATTLTADLLIIDEKKARGIAKNLGIKITGTLGILVDAKRQNKIQAIKPLLDELIRHNIRISEKLYGDILALVDEKGSTD